MQTILASVIALVFLFVGVYLGRRLKDEPEPNKEVADGETLEPISVNEQIEYEIEQQRKGVKEW